MNLSADSGKIEISKERKGTKMKQCCYNLKAIGLTCHHEERHRPSTFTAEEIRKYIN